MEDLLIYIVSGAINIIFMSFIYMVFLYLTTKLFKFEKKGWKTAFVSGLALSFVSFLSSVVWIQLVPQSILNSVLSIIIWIVAAACIVKYFYKERIKRSFYVILIIWVLQMATTFVLTLLLSSLVPNLGMIT